MGKDLTVLVRVWFPVTDTRQHPAQQSLFELAMADAALFHAIMCSSSVYLDITSGSFESSQSIIHKMEAIHLINAQLKDTPAVSDATIGAVASLATVEVCHYSDARVLRRT
jgi:Fungal specific transcription factor domain